jgi:hypothetical protein
LDSRRGDVASKGGFASNKRKINGLILVKTTFFVHFLYRHAGVIFAPGIGTKADTFYFAVAYVRASVAL